jgi:hypothetical protein
MLEEVGRTVKGYLRFHLPYAADLLPFDAAFCICGIWYAKRAPAMFFK